MHSAYIWQSFYMFHGDCMIKNIHQSHPSRSDTRNYFSNLSLSKGVFPTELKLANVIPLV